MRGAYEINSHNRSRDEARRAAMEERSREKLIVVIAKINDLEPTMGGKWRRNMLSFYIACLAELVLHQSGFVNPTKAAMEPIEAEIRDLFDLTLD